MSKILVVDNEQDTVDLVAMILSNTGYEILKAFNGKECLEIYKKSAPDLILLDIMMPDLSGWDVFQRIKTKDKKQKVAFMSALDVSEERLIQLKKSGLVGYIVKPFDSDKLIEEVKKMLEM